MMSEQNGYATKDAFKRYSGTRRFRDAEIPGVGKLILRSLSAKEYVKVDAARTRSFAAMASDNAENQEAALIDGYLDMVKLMVLDGNHQPMFTDEDDDFLLELDSCVTTPLVNACLDHSGIEKLDAEETAKNS